MVQLGGDWRFLLAEMPKGATVKPPFVGDKPRQRGFAARGVFKLGYGKPFLNYSKTRFASFALELKTKDSGINSRILCFLGIGEIGKANRRKGQSPFFNSLSKRAKRVSV